MRPSVDRETFGVCEDHAPARALACPACLALREYPHQAARLRLVAAARALVGSPFIYRSRSGRQGVDCSGLVICSARAVGLSAPAFESYPDVFTGDPFRDAWATHCDPIDVAIALPGDVLLCRTRRVLGHVRLVTERGTLIHASRKRGVVEDPLDGAVLRFIDSAVRLREFREV